MSPLPLPTLRLLLVDDGPVGLEPLIRYQFATIGQPVTVTVESAATDDVSAITERHLDFDVLLLALDLALDGNVERLQQVTIAAGAKPVVLISPGIDDAALHDRALQAGAAEVVTRDAVPSEEFTAVVRAAASHAHDALDLAGTAPRPAPRWLKHIPAIAALLLILLGSAATLGWLIGSTTLTSVDSSLPSLKLRAAIGFILVGASLLLLRKPTVGRLRAANAVAGLICAFTVVTLTGLILRRDLGLNAIESLAAGNAGNAAPLTAVGFFCLGLTQLTLEARHHLLRRLHVAAALGFGTVTLLAAQAWAFGSELLIGPNGANGMSILGLAGLLIAFVGMSAQRPERKPMRWLTDDTPGAALIRRLAPGVLLAPPALLVLRLIAQDSGWWDLQFSLAVFSTVVIVLPLLLMITTAAAIDRREASRRRMADAVRDSERRFRAFGALAPVGIFEMDLSGNNTYVNAAWCALTGLSPSQAWGRGWQRAVHPDDLAQVLAADERPVEAEEPGAEVFRALRPDGTIAWMASRRAHVYDSAGNPTGYIGTITDVTALKDAETVARESEAQLQALLDHAPMSVSFRDRDGRLRAANRDALTRMGLSAEEAVGSSLQDVMDAEGAAVVAAQEQLVAETREAVTFEIRANTLDGGEANFFVTKYPVLDQDGNVTGTGGLLLDVTERKLAEKQAVEAQQRFQLSFEHAPIGMAIVGADGRFVRVNRALCKITDHSEAELLATSFRALTHPDDRAANDALMGKIARGELESVHLDKRYIRRSGEAIWASIDITVLSRGEDGLPELLLGQVQDISERRHLEHRLQHLADHDPLTGLLNRRGFDQELDRHMAHTLRYGPRGALVILDLDHFKAVNDTFGHQAGDELIVTVASLLRARLRDTDAIARLGGDEFAILLSEADADAAADVAASIVEAVRTGAAVSSGGRPHLVTGSVGVAPLDELVKSAGNAMSNADQAMYDAKEAGRDRHKVYTPERHDGQRKQAQLSWVRRIRETLSDERFQLFTQPILNLHTGKVRQHEVLLRMADDAGKIILPAAFLPTAERYDLIQDIDRWVTQRSIETIAAYNAAGQELVLEVNLSGKSIGDQRLLDLVETQLEKTPIDPGALIFEITETAAVADIPQARQFADHLTALGCRFALDDFGAGFGSLYYLKHLPFDYLKIDGEFITGCMQGGTDQLVIEALVSIASGLGKETIAECVENEVTQQYLRKLGVDYAQGIHVGRPEPIAPPDGGRAARPLRAVI